MYVLHFYRIYAGISMGLHMVVVVVFGGGGRGRGALGGGNTYMLNYGLASFQMMHDINFPLSKF